MHNSFMQGDLASAPPQGGLRAIIEAARRRARRRRFGFLLLAIAAAGVAVLLLHGPKNRPPNEIAQPGRQFTSDDVSVQLAKGWFVIDRAVPNIINPKPILAASNVPPARLGWNGRGSCPGGWRVPPHALVLSVVAYGKPYGNVPVRPPGTLRSADGQTANFDCRGHATSFNFRRGGQTLQAYVSFDAGRLNGPDRQQVLRMLNSLMPLQGSPTETATP